MKTSILNTHIFMCNRKSLNPETTPMKIVPEMFYGDDNTFNQPLFNKVVGIGIIDRSQSMEERGALGQRYLISVALFNNL